MRIANPRAGFTGTKRFIVLQFAVQGLDQPDAVAQGRIDRVGRFVFKIGEVIEAANPVTLFIDIALKTAFV